jgi:hypothetical protein
LRPLGDLDLLVADRDMPAAAAILTAMGYRQEREEAADLHHHWTFVRMVGRAASVTVELHRRAMASPPYDRLLATEQLVARATWLAPTEGRPPSRSRAVDASSSPTRFQGGGYAVLDRPDSLLHTAAHLVLQHPGEERLIWVADVDRLSRGEGGRSAFWSEVTARASAASLSRSVADSLRMSRLWFATPVPTEVLADLEAAVTAEEDAIYRRLRARAPVGREGARLLVDARGIGGLSGKLRYALAYAFPPAEYMRARHPASRGWMLPIYYGRRVARGAADILLELGAHGRGPAEEAPEERMIDHGS